MSDPSNLTIENITNLFQNRVVELQEEPEFQWKRESIKYALDDNGNPSVKVAIGNVPLDYDLWKGLRNPAVVGIYPASLKEMWEYHAHRRRARIDDYGRQTIFQIPTSFESAKKKFKRAVIISIMLPFSHKVIKDYQQAVSNERDRSSYIFRRMYEDVNLMANKAIGRVGIDLASIEGVVLAMNDDNVTKVSEDAVPLTHQGDSHGPSKDGNYPQKSLAVLLGLGQFGVSRIVFRDEVVDNRIKRFVGPLRSILVFDEKEPIKDGSGGVIYPTEKWRRFLHRLYDFTDVDPKVNEYRFCSYVPLNDGGCGKCINYCPSGALVNSAPMSDGVYSELVSNQAHRFYDGQLQFDYAKCCETRGQMANLLPEWSCARCVSICAAEGNQRIFAAKNFSKKLNQLTTK
jgi:ferredoxin